MRSVTRTRRGITATKPAPRRAGIHRRVALGLLGAAAAVGRACYLHLAWRIPLGFTTPAPRTIGARTTEVTYRSGTEHSRATVNPDHYARIEVPDHDGPWTQAALRRVATLVAQAAPPGEVLTAVTGEAGRLLHADYATMNRYDPDGAITVVASWSSVGAAFPVGTTARLGGRNMQAMVFQTRRAARIDDYAIVSGQLAEAARDFGIRAAVGVPVSVGGRLWGIMLVGSRAGPLPAGAEARLAGFTELAATAIANAEAQTALKASGARIVATADATRRRFERNLHDGVQQRLVSLALDLRAAAADASAGTGELAQQLDRVAAGLDGVLEDLREIARGLHPAILAAGGLRPALKTLARRSVVPVDLDVQVDRRLREPVEIAAYYTVAEALTNAARHACATAAEIEAAESDGVLHVRVRDNGRGGAGFGDGSGLVGLADRAEALGGHLQLDSPPGAGTTLEITLPLHDPGPAGLPPGAAEPSENASHTRSLSSRGPGAAPLRTVTERLWGWGAKVGANVRGHPAIVGDIRHR
jgi:signal transduction histidine kinase